MIWAHCQREIAEYSNYCYSCGARQTPGQTLQANDALGYGEENCRCLRGVRRVFRCRPDDCALGLGGARVCTSSVYRSDPRLHHRLDRRACGPTARAGADRQAIRANREAELNEKENICFLARTPGRCLPLNLFREWSDGFEGSSELVAPGCRRSRPSKKRKKGATVGRSRVPAINRYAAQRTCRWPRIPCWYRPRRSPRPARPRLAPASSGPSLSPSQETPLRSG